VHRILAIREIGILALVALVGYVIAGFWVRYDLHYYINDALNRTDDALYVTVGRDPHAAAIGFYWPPLPQLLQVPLVPFLEPHGLTVMAGPISTALCMAATIPVMAQIGRFLNLGRWTTFGFCLVFALNPVTIYYSTNGMSEACFFFTGSLSLLGFLRYIRTHSTFDMTLLGFGLAGSVLTRLEGPLFALGLAIAAAFSWRCLVDLKALRQATWTAFLIGLPALAAFGTWLAVQAVVEHNALYFLGISGGGASPDATWLPPHSAEPWASFAWAANWVLVLGAPLYLVAFSLIWSSDRTRTRGSAGLMVAIGVFLAIQIYTVGFQGGGFGNPRYFVMAVPFATIAAMWLASTKGHTWSPLWNLSLMAILLGNGASASWYLSSGKVTHVEHECTFFQGTVAKLLPALGRGGNPHTSAYCSNFGNPLAAYQSADTYLDKVLLPSDRVLTDNSTVFPANLFTTRPDQFIVRNDRDWEKISADPYGTVTYILTQGLTRTSSPLVATDGNNDFGAQTVDADPSSWKLAGSWEESASYDSYWVQVYRVVGTGPSS